MIDARSMEALRASDGITLRYLIDDYSDPWREPETLFLLHAAMGSSRRFYAWVPRLAREFRVVRPDMRGHGESDVPGPDGLTVKRLVGDVFELADHLRCERFHIAGSSAGAMIAMQAALERPDRVLSLGTFASPPGLKHSLINEEQWAAKIRSKGLRAFFEDTLDERFPAGTDPAFLHWFVDEACRTSEDIVCRFVPMMRGVDLTARLREIRCPMLAVVPDSDPHISLEHYEKLRDAAPGCEFVVYHGFQHNITDVVPDRCAAELGRFLASHGFPKTHRD